MTPDQLTALFAASPFLILAVVWIISLSFFAVFIDGIAKPRPVRVKKERDNV
jgi:hypothetical protein